MTEEGLSPIGQSKTWTARKALPVACVYAAAHRWAAREAGESSSPIMTMPFVIMIKGPVTGFRCQIGCCLDAGCRTDRTRRGTGRVCRVCSLGAPPAAARESARCSARRFRTSHP